MITTHVLDIAAGRPAEGVLVILEQSSTSGWTELGRGPTDADGRQKSLSAASIAAGVYRLRFDTAAYFRAKNVRAFFPEVTVAFEIDDVGRHYHVPLLLSPYGYSTYRGS